MSYKAPSIKFNEIKLPYLKFYVISLFLNVLLIALLLYFQKKIPPSVPLWYGGPAGENQLAPKILIILPNSIAFIVSSLNIFLTRFIKDDFLHQVFIGLTITASVLATITVINIIFLVGSI